MIPHAPPIRFPEIEGEFHVNPDNPMVRDGVLGPYAAVELAAQAVGRVVGRPGQTGKLVLVEDLEPLGKLVAGSRVRPIVNVTQRLGPLVRVHVEIPGVVRGVLTLYLDPP